jgi:cellulose synthase/poly-beta-1,6-N-acetylglucosamine synthase-like glycosyltransferase
MIPGIFHNVFFDIFLSAIILIFAGLTFIASHREPMKTTFGSYEDRALVIVPCKGRDYTLDENLRGIMANLNAKWEAVAVVDSEDDAAVGSIRGSGMDMIISDDSCRKCSGKVRAIASAINHFPDFPVYVIADSDILPDEDWLKLLLAPLSQNSVGISTTFPYFRPAGGFWSFVKLVWGFVGQGMMESRITRFGWGGSLAFRSELLKGRGLDFFRSYVSDDVALTKLCKKAGLEIAYVPEAAPVINSPDDFSTFIEWANRQTALSVYSTPSVFRYGIVFYGATILVFISALILAFSISPFFALLLAPSVITSTRNAKRSRERKTQVFLLSFIIPFIYFYNLIKARSTETIQWRGSSYLLGEEP